MLTVTETVVLWLRALLTLSVPVMVIVYVPRALLGSVMVIVTEFPAAIGVVGPKDIFTPVGADAVNETDPA